MNSNIAPQSSQDDAVIRLKCPECSGGLNLRRVHLGISGKCVHCKTPITAVEEAGVISVKRSGDIAASTPAPPLAPAPDPTPASYPAMTEEPEPVQETASHFVPPPLSPAPAASPPPLSSSAAEASSSAWGFPDRDETSEDSPVATLPAAAPAAPATPAGFSDIALPGAEISAPMAPMAPMAPTGGFGIPGDSPAAAPAAPAAPVGFSDIAASGAENSALTEENPAPMGGFRIPETTAAETSAGAPFAGGFGIPDSGNPDEEPSTAFRFSEKPAMELSAEAAPAAEVPAEKISGPPPLPTSEDASDLFETKGDFASSPLFSSVGTEMSASWGAKVPDQKHASISPFSTGSAEPDPGFAETLFREKVKEDTGNIQPRSPFAEPDGNGNAPLASEALFGSSPVGAKPAGAEKEVVLDGDGRPLREMTPEERERFAQDVMHFSDVRKGSSWLKRLAKLVATIVVLGGIGFGAYVFLPQEQVEVAKAKIIDWLEPGSVLMQYLPFEIGSSEDGEKGGNIKALEGLSNLSGQMDQYLNAAEDNLNSTLGEGAEGYQREKPIDTPELPGMPKIPGVKMPELPGAVPGDVAE